MLILTTFARNHVRVWNQSLSIQKAARFHSSSVTVNTSSLFRQYWQNNLRTYCLINKRFLNFRFAKNGIKNRAGTSSNGFLSILSGTLAVGSVAGCKLFSVAVLCQGTKKKSRLNRTDGAEKNGPETPFPWKEFFKLLLPDIWYLIGAVLSALAVAFINIKIPLMLGDVVNVLAEYSRNPFTELTSSLTTPALRLVYMYILQGMLTSVYISLLSAVGERVAARMRCRLFESIIVQDMAFFDATKTGELINRLTTDIQDFKSSFKMCVSQGLKNLAQTFGCLVSLFVISPHLTIFMGGVVTTIIAVGSFMGSGLRQLSRLAQTQVSKSTAVADEAFGNIRTVRAFAMEPMEVELYTHEVEHSAHLNQMLGIGIGVFQGLSNIALNGMVLGTLYVGGQLMSNNSINAGDLMSFLVATQTIQRSLGQMSLLFGQAVRGLSAGCRVFEYILIKPTMNISGGSVIPHESLTGRVRFSDVEFSYPTRSNQKVLDKFNLNIEGGQIVALVGLSGGGKSTVAALLERFYDVESGKIELDGHDIRSLDPSWLRGSVIGFINQEPVLFATTVMENIRYGRPHATDEEVIRAAKLANAHDFIQTFPDGYSTVLGERGVTVSGGQKQRLAIARALIKSPAVLILDEATSALDAESERVVQEALERVSKGRTVLVIAHRLSTVKDADCIAVVANGKIVESGTHEDLKERRGIYWNLIKNQDLDYSNGKNGKNGRNNTNHGH